MKILTKMLEVDVSETKWSRIIVWWELRRIIYNLILISFLGSSLLILSFFPNDGFIRFYPGPMLAFSFYTGIILYFIVANLLYTSGWIFQLTTRKLDGNNLKFLTKKSLIIGIIVSGLISFSPIVLAVINLIIGLI